MGRKTLSADYLTASAGLSVGPNATEAARHNERQSRRAFQRIWLDLCRYKAAFEGLTGGPRFKPNQLTRDVGPGSDPDSQDWTMDGDGPVWILSGGLSICISRKGRHLTVEVMEHGKEGDGSGMEECIDIRDPLNPKAREKKPKAQGELPWSSKAMLRKALERRQHESRQA